MERYDSAKYLEFEEDDRELLGESKPSGMMSFFTFVFSAVARADFNKKKAKEETNRDHRSDNVCD